MHTGVPGMGDVLRALAARFPDTGEADPVGVVCQGGNLSLPLLLAAYSRGIFPWFNEGEPILWWSPDPRCVIVPEEYHCPKRALRAMKKAAFRVTCDTAFDRVIQACGMRKETWLGPSMKAAYLELHEAGFAHSVEAWQGNTLVGGLYGLALGRAFFGESMFHTVSEASRVSLRALIALMQKRGMTLLDCQQESAHIMAQGGRLLARRDFEARLQEALTYCEDAQDMLTLEYASVPAAERRLWPFLPWKRDYGQDVWQDGAWQECGLDERGRSL